MAVGKNKRLSKGKKGKGKKIVDPFTKKEWYDIKAPGNFSVRNCGKTPVTRTTGTKIASEMLKGRVFEVCLADLNKDEDQHYRKIKLQCEEVQGHSCLTQFYGLTFTTDKLRSMVKKWQSLIEAHVDVKTSDGYVMRLFCIGFTKKRPNQLKKTQLGHSDEQTQLLPKKGETVAGHRVEIEKACQGIYPMQNVHIRKVKMLKKPKFDLTKLLEAHGDSGPAAAAADTGDKVEVAADADPAARPDRGAVL
ncbi:hypothetical protein EMIHUDRAFT_316252 [Emiliania huxleyi CCMP1516]|uniref:Small ribosomal subunit protein eS1 n=2 Tax=Emiliania huxleyi TaxID=2903 RepID=A0A0D3J628_EMIH1|nr:hypothetical protein EMIHUDRAFT_316252 [Emiliania huxleyi CCMP1516]EOD18963.1 hypothetical protein EMIHUDRAFT_316252 [Emiliania huxleyi CCMP1516]|eukprot:XP_005771392.1 hypothetical protein EMIHUDRAFT_316252 [Emiliania huxleyi CCMP1516]